MTFARRRSFDPRRGGEHPAIRTARLVAGGRTGGRPITRQSRAATPGVGCCRRLNVRMLCFLPGTTQRTRGPATEGLRGYPALRLAGFSVTSLGAARH
jgi:hypothetical protein